MGTQNTLAASVQPKKGRLYAVIQVKENGKSKAVWRSLGARRHRKIQGQQSIQGGGEKV